MATTGSKTAVKSIYGDANGKQGSKTYNNMNPEASNENLVAAVGEFNGLQNKPVLEIQRIDTTVISG